MSFTGRRLKLLAPLIPALALLAGCEPRKSMVYVLEAPQTVTLVPSASATSARVGDEVRLHLERRTDGAWKQIPRDELKPGQCWLYRPPAQSEEEAAHNVHWQVVPENAVVFSAAYQLDRTRIAMMRAPGTITLTPISTVPCEPNRAVKGPSIQVEVS